MNGRLSVSAAAFFVLVAARLALALLGSAGVMAHADDCPGDCNGGGTITVDELTIGVQLALGRLPTAACPSFDRNADGQVTIDELIQSINLALLGCPGPTPPAPSTDTPRPLPTPTGAASALWQFVDVTAAAGLDAAHRYVLSEDSPSEPAMMMGGVAAGDFDGDGWVDLYIVGGNAASNRLLRNLGNGTFRDVIGSAGLDIAGQLGCGPTFADFDGDGRLDLFIGGVEGTRPRLFRNRGEGTFEDVTSRAGLDVREDTFSAAFGDYDRDGYLDLLMTHWMVFGPNRTPVEHLWHNTREGGFVPITLQAGLAALGAFLPADGNNLFSFSFTPNFADINNDGWPDLLITSDFGTSRVFLNQADGHFLNATTPSISDENGMGAAVGDYDNDGDLDWFVSSIYDPNGSTQPSWGVSGNRLYQNQGDGSFIDVTESAGVRQGFWGWGSCFADFNNDGFLDLFQVNGMGYLDGAPTGIWMPGAEEFYHDPARLFLSNGDGTFTERAASLGVADAGQGRGVVCFDFDHDGDIDIFIANNGQAARLYRNDGGNHGNFLEFTLQGRLPNSQAIGARVYVTTGAQTQMREIRAGSNFESQDPATAHFGLAHAPAADDVRVVWPEQSVTDCGVLAANHFVRVDQQRGTCVSDDR